MRAIEVANRFLLLCDSEDFAILARYRWRAARQMHSAPRPMRKTTRAGRKGVLISPHHELLGKPPAGLVWDHINGNPWDNRRNNLRLATHAENMRNRRVSRKANGAGKGVQFRDGRWVCRIKCNNRNYTVGGFATMREAELAYDSMARHFHGDFACLNHPDVPTSAKSPDDLRIELGREATDRLPVRSVRRHLSNLPHSSELPRG